MSSPTAGGMKGAATGSPGAARLKVARPVPGGTEGAGGFLLPKDTHVRVNAFSVRTTSEFRVTVERFPGDPTPLRWTETGARADRVHRFGHGIIITRRGRGKKTAVGVQERKEGQSEWKDAHALELHRNPGSILILDGTDGRVNISFTWEE